MESSALYGYPNRKKNKDGNQQSEPFLIILRATHLNNGLRNFGGWENRKRSQHPVWILLRGMAQRPSMKRPTDKCEKLIQDVPPAASTEADIPAQHPYHRRVSGGSGIPEGHRKVHFASSKHPTTMVASRYTD
jgi:hypothetical protein